MKEPHLSDSTAQRKAETRLVESLSQRLGIPLAKGVWVLADGVRVEIDGMAPDRSVLVEVYARIGTLKGSQPKKVAQDALKLLAVREKARAEGEDPRLILCFASQEATNSIRGWLRWVIEEQGVEMRVEELTDDMAAAVVRAQEGQVMVNVAQQTDAEAT